MSRVYEIADGYVDRFAALDPVSATAVGIAGHDGEMTDYSPDGAAAQAELARETVRSVGEAPVEDDRDRVAAALMREELGLALELYEAGHHLRALNVLHCPLQSVRMAFDLMGRETGEGWRNVAARLALVPAGLEGYRASLAEGLRRGLVAARRQVLGAAAQAETWSGATGASSYFGELVVAYDSSGIGDASLRADLARGGMAAAEAYAGLARYLREEYLPRAREKDGVGREEYSLAARVFCGTELDLEETYAWGWEQVRWVESEMAATAGRIAPGKSVREVIDLLNCDPGRSIEGAEEFRRWMQELQDRTIAAVDGVHFDLPERVKRVEAKIAPPGGALAMYYTGPSEDFSRPGCIWYPTGERTRFPLWQEVSIGYHEGVPGHHFQIATTVHLVDELSRYQRLIGGTSGYVEGWALYAERLMGEFGYLDDPDYYLGMLSAQALRSIRVVVDIGMHLDLRIPADCDFHPGERWNADLANEILRERAGLSADFAASEADRYLGLPGQAISYKVGERVWLAARETARQKAGAAFDLKEWHNRALRMGPMGLAQMERELGGAQGATGTFA
ncbi:MAG: DUF885 domain-containing protein [Chloroflexi bacterium]|nr:DUF885 domain-containing protein [Chloroflexota bacterium]